MPKSVGSRRGGVPVRVVVSCMTNASEGVEVATGYAAARSDERPAAGRDEVWLRGNVRPVLGIGALACGGAALALGGAVAAGAGPALIGTLGGATAAVAVTVAVLARAASGLRLGRRDDRLLLRLSPWRTDAVPLGVVECVFPGSQPLPVPGLPRASVDEADAAGSATSARRVGTLVIRFAERATEWRQRPTFAAWGTWHDGHAVVDGRWCEPLSAEVARSIGQRLLEAKREAGTAEAHR